MMDEDTLRKLQNTELEILTVLDKYCTDNGIMYSLYGGTALGAVRHSGFIPWDDDIDIVMTRGEYNKLIEEIKSKPIDGYTLYSPELVAECSICHAKFIKSNTLFLSEGEYEDKDNQGIWIDIFPVDKITEKTKERIYNIGRKIIFLTRARTRNKNDGYVKSFVRFAGRLIPDLIAKDRINKYLLELALNDLEEHEHFKWTVLAATYTFKYIFDARIMNRLHRTEFEGKQFLLTDEYDQMLRTLYGDYMTLPPINEQVPKHKPLKIIF